MVVGSVASAKSDKEWDGIGVNSGVSFSSSFGDKGQNPFQLFQQSHTASTGGKVS